MRNYEEEEFVKNCEKFDAERQKEEDNLTILEIKVRKIVVNRGKIGVFRSWKRIKRGFMMKMRSFYL